MVYCDSDADGLLQVKTELMFWKKNKAVAKKKKGKSGFRKANDWLHLWMGLTSGLIVFIVSITGCIYVFEKEIRSVTQPYQFVEAQDKPFLPPSQLKKLAADYAFGNNADSLGKLIQNVGYGGRNKAATASYNDKDKGFISIYMNPYTGEYLETKYFKSDFFRWILDGHFYLWLPNKIGQPVVAISILIFFFLLITGLIMWWPKNLKKANREKSFMIKWAASFKRVNYDLHNVLGFYVLTVALLITITGLVWGFKWWAKGTYWITSGGKTLPEFKRPFSDTTGIASYTNGEDIIWQKALKEHYSETGSLTIQIPIKPTDAYGIMFNPDEGKNYRRQFRYFDRNTLAELKGTTGIYRQPFEKATTADKIARMNYDIHVGAVLGIPGKIMAFFASLICASLPITGFLVWWGKRKKKGKSGVKKQAMQEKTAVRFPRPALSGAAVQQPALVPDADPVQYTGASGEAPISGT